MVGKRPDRERVGGSGMMGRHQRVKLSCYRLCFSALLGGQGLETASNDLVTGKNVERSRWGDIASSMLRGGFDARRDGKQLIVWISGRGK